MALVHCLYKLLVALFRLDCTLLEIQSIIITLLMTTFCVTAITCTRIHSILTNTYITLPANSSNSQCCCALLFNGNFQQKLSPLYQLRLLSTELWNDYICTNSVARAVLSFHSEKVKVLCVNYERCHRFALIRKWTKF